MSLFENKRANTTLSCVPILFGLALLCSGPVSADVMIPVQFDDAGCPVEGSVPDVDAERGKKVIWQAVDRDGAPTSVAFRIYFDPTRGSSVYARRGKASRPIEDDAPKVDYKYTVVADDCRDKPEDPNIRVY